MLGIWLVCLILYTGFSFRKQKWHKKRKINASLSPKPCRFIWSWAKAVSVGDISATLQVLTATWKTEWFYKLWAVQIATGMNCYKNELQILSSSPQEEDYTDKISWMTGTVCYNLRLLDPSILFSFLYFFNRSSLLQITYRVFQKSGLSLVMSPHNYKAGI